MLPNNSDPAASEEDGTVEECPTPKKHDIQPSAAVAAPASPVLVRRLADSLVELLAQAEVGRAIVPASTVLDSHLLGLEVEDLEQRRPKQEGARERTKAGRGTTALMMRWQGGLLEVLAVDPPRVWQGLSLH